MGILIMLISGEYAMMTWTMIMFATGLMAGWAAVKGLD